MTTEPTRITLTYLRSLGACSDGLNDFRRAFPRGLTVKPGAKLTKRTAERLATLTGHFPWFTQTLPAPARAEYDRVTALAEYERRRVIAPALTEYDRATAPARAEYDRATAAALAECRRVIAPAVAEYDRATAADRAEYDRVIAAARAPARAEYDRARAPARAEYDRARVAARAEYDRARVRALWAVLGGAALGGAA